MLLTPGGVISTKVLYDNVGAGYGGTNTSISFAHPGSGSMGGNYVLVGIDYGVQGGTISAITYGGTTMSLIASQTNGNVAGAGTTAFYGLAATTAQTVAVTLSSNAWGATVNSVSYKNVTTAAAGPTAYGTSFCGMNPMTGGVGEMMVNAFGGQWSSLINTVNSDGYIRYNNPGTGYGWLVIADSMAASALFQASYIPSADNQWAGVGVVLS